MDVVYTELLARTLRNREILLDTTPHACCIYVAHGTFDLCMGSISAIIAFAMILFLELSIAQVEPFSGPILFVELTLRNWHLSSGRGRF
jgi:hypothetical protein